MAETPPDHPKDSAYRPDIDGLRAFAILPVVFFHAFPQIIRGGFTGVDVFFVISGFLISGIIVRNLERGVFSLVDFYSRRILRIFPSLIFVLSGSLAFAWFGLFADEFQQIGKHIAAASAFIANYVLWQEAGYFDGSADTKPLLHLWSLSIEEQFYILWPPLLILFWKKKRLKILLTLLVLLASLYLNLRDVHRDIIATFYSPQTRFWELLAGSLLAWLSSDHFDRSKNITKIQGRSSKISEGASVTGLGLLIFSVAFISPKFSFPGLWACFPVMGASLLIGSGPSAFINRKLLAHPLAIGVGQISYPLYLWHWPLLSFARILEGGTPSPKVRLCAVFIALGLAWLTYHYIERPIRFGRNKKRAILPLIVIIAALGVTGYFAYAQKVIPWGAMRVNEITRQIGWEIPAGTKKQIADCRAMFPEREGKTVKERDDDNFCYLQKPGPPDVILIGDSLNLSLFPGLSHYDDYNLLLLSASAQAPFFEVRTTERNDSYRERYFELTNQALEFAIHNDNIRVVVMSFLNGVALTNPEHALKITDIRHSDRKDAHAIFIEAFRNTLDHLIKAGKGVVFVLPNPDIPYDIKTCLSGIRPFQLPGLRSNCGESRQDYMKRGGETYRAWVASVLKDYPSVKVFDLARYFCDKQYCWSYKNQMIFYRDTGHLSANGSNLVAPDLHRVIIDALELNQKP